MNIHQVAPGGSSHGLIAHVGEEMGYVLQGMLDLTVGDRGSRVFKDDAFFFRIGRAAWLREPGDEVARI